MTEAKTESKSQLELLGKAETQWEIVGWTGPLQHVVRPTAECIVNIPTGNKANDDIRLRFYFKYYKLFKESTDKFCQHRNKFIGLSVSCNCPTCRLFPIQNSNDTIPRKLLPETTVRSAGYSLLVDVLSCPVDKLTLAVSGSLNGNTCFYKQPRCVTLGPKSTREGVPVEHALWRTLMWTEGKGGIVENWVRCARDNVQDAKLQLKVEAYIMTSTATKATAQHEVEKLTESPVVSKLPDNPENNIPNLGDKTSGVFTKLPEAAILRCHKSGPMENREYFRRKLETKSGLPTNLGNESMLCLSQWIYANGLTTMNWKLTSNYENGWETILQNLRERQHTSGQIPKINTIFPYQPTLMKHWTTFKRKSRNPACGMIVCALVALAVTGKHFV